MPDQLVMISPWSLIPSPHNSRKRFHNLEELAESIRQNGVLQNLVVRPASPEMVATEDLALAGSRGLGEQPFYEVVAGGRRMRAARLASVDSVPCLIRDLTDRDVREIVLTENSQREDVHPLEEAETMRLSLAAGDYGPAEAKASKAALAARLGLSLSYVYQRLLLMNLCPEVQEEFLDGEIPASHAVQLARLPAEAQKRLLKELLYETDYSARTEADRNVKVGCKMSARSLDKYIARQFNRKLTAASFDIDDANLLKVAGPCKMCPKRTGFAGDMLADVSPCTSDTDRCLDPDCWNEKEERAGKARVREMRVKYPEAVLVSDGWADARKGVVSRSGYNDAKKDDPGAVLAIVETSGWSESAGDLKYVVLTADAETLAEADAERERKRTESKARVDAENAFRKALFEHLDYRFPQMTLALLREVTRALLGTAYAEHKKELRSAFRLTAKADLDAHLDTLDEEGLNRALVILICVKERVAVPWDIERGRQADCMIRLAESMGLDVDAFREQFPVQTSTQEAE